MSEKRGKGLLESHGTSQTEGEKRSGWGLCTLMYQELKMYVTFAERINCYSTYQLQLKIETRYARV